MRTTTLASLTSLVLALALAACGGDAGAAKEGAMKMAADVMPASAMKDGPGTATKAAQTFTATNLGDAASKGTASISVGDRETGSLSGGDPQLDDGSHFDLWGIKIISATEVDIQMTSTDFDTYMMLGAGSPGDVGQILAEDDDGAGGTDSRITGTLEPGTYTIIANSYAGGATGSYTLSVMGSSSGDSGEAVQGRLTAGSPSSGQFTSASPTLTDGSHYHLWQFNGQAGEQVTITQRSEDFDSYLMLVRGMSVSSESMVASDDDGAGGLDSRVTVTLPETGTYSAVVNSYGADATGRYTIELQATLANWDDQYPGGGDPNGKYAVVVGIDDYPGTRNDLRGPVDDAMLVRDALVNRFGFSTENIVFLQDAEATRLGIANAILRHLGQAGPGGTAVFMYSGHGTKMDSNVGITGAYDPESGNNVDEALAVYDGVILDEEVNFLLQQIEAENTLVLVDACFSGTVNRAADAMAKFIPEDQVAELRKPTTFITADLTSDFGFGTGAEFRAALANPDRHVFMAASSEDQVSWAIGSWPDRSGPASLWTYYWAQVVNEVPTSTSFNDIQRMVSERVNRHVDQSQNLDTQTPQILGPSSKRSMSIGAFLGN